MSGNYLSWSFFQAVCTRTLRGVLELDCWRCPQHNFIILRLQLLPLSNYIQFNISCDSGMLTEWNKLKMLQMVWFKQRLHVKHQQGNKQHSSCLKPADFRPWKRSTWSCCCKTVKDFWKTRKPKGMKPGTHIQWDFTPDVPTFTTGSIFLCFLLGFLSLLLFVSRLVCWLNEVQGKVVTDGTHMWP